MSNNRFEGEHGQIGTQAKTDAQVFAINSVEDNKLFYQAFKQQKAGDDKLQSLGFASGTEIFASNQKFEKSGNGQHREETLLLYRESEGKGHRREDELLMYKESEGMGHRAEDNLLLYKRFEGNKGRNLDLQIPSDAQPAKPSDADVQINDNGVKAYRRFEGARAISLDDVPSEFKPNQPDGSMRIVNTEGVYTFWPNGSANVRRFDGTGYAYNPDGKGGYEYKQWGKSDKDNFSSKYDKASDSLTEVDAQGTVLTRWSDGSELCQKTDGTGYSKKFMPTHNYMTRTEHWGPKPEDNYSSIYNVITKIGQIQGRKSS